MWSGTLLVRREGRRAAFSSATGYVSWTTRDFTDLDYSPLPLLTRDDAERDGQFTQELRVASAAGAPARLSDGVTLAWQAGLVPFTQRYAQDAVNAFVPHVLSPQLPLRVSQHSPRSDLDDGGLGGYGQGTVTFGGALDLVLGARFDREWKRARLDTFYVPPVAPPTVVDAERAFGDVSPQAALAWRASRCTAYVSAGRGFKAGGFNPASPPGSESYGQEHAWNVEGGLKTTWAEGRLIVSGGVFRIAWDDMQVNVPSAPVPGQFYIANVAGARSNGVEIEVNARPRAAVDLFASLGIARASFTDGSVSGGVDVSGNDLPNTPGYSASFGAQYSRTLGAATSLFGRADLVWTGAYRYDDANLEGQDAYSLVHLRGGVRAHRVSAEVWVRNAFDTRYVPVAFAYGSLAPSGFVGEPGHPRTFGVSVGIGIDRP